MAPHGSLLGYICRAYRSVHIVMFALGLHLPMQWPGDGFALPVVQRECSGCRNRQRTSTLTVIATKCIFPYLRSPDDPAYVEAKRIEEHGHTRTLEHVHGGLVHGITGSSLGIG